MADVLFNSSFANGIISDFSVTNVLSELKPLILFIAGIVIYAMFIYKFYHFIARKDILGLNLHERGLSSRAWLKYFFRVSFYVIENLILIPILILFWFVILAVLMLLLSKNQSVQTILLISMSLIGAVRITAYFNESLSKELAKLLPFVLLGVFLVDISFFSISQTLEKAMQIPTVIKSLLYYLVFIILLEFILRIVSYVFRSKPNSLE